MSARSRKPGVKKKKRKTAGQESGLTSATRIFCLGFQSDFVCRNCGDCCSTWDIPLEKTPLNSIRRALRKGQIARLDGGDPQSEDWLVHKHGETKGTGRFLSIKKGKECCFLERGEETSCVLQRQIGVEAMPATCRLFPRMCVLQPRGVFLTLSHYCPSAAEMPFREDLEEGRDLEIVRNPPAYPRKAGYGGLDARNHKPPLLRPNVLMSWEASGLWERHTVQTMARRDYSPEEALILLVTSAEKARQFSGAGTPGTDALGEIFEKDRRADPATVKSQIGGLPSGLPRAKRIYDRLLSLDDSENPGMEKFLEAYRARYASGGAAVAAERFAGDYDRLVRPAWRKFETPIRRYLAAKLFANYYVYQSDGLRSGLFAVAAALASLRVHAALLCARKDRELDRESLVETFRQTDLLLVHRLPRNRLARFFSLVETGDLMEILGAVPD